MSTGLLSAICLLCLHLTKSNRSSSNEGLLLISVPIVIVDFALLFLKYIVSSTHNECQTNGRDVANISSDALTLGSITNNACSNPDTVNVIDGNVPPNVTTQFY